MLLPIYYVLTTINTDYLQLTPINDYYRPHGPANTLSQPCYMNICNPAIILILSASRPYSHATQEQFPPISLSRLTPDAAQATAEAHGCASSGAAGGTQRPSSRPRICHLCYHIVFSVLPFVLSDIYRTEDHKPRGRASDVSTISTCLSYMS